MKYVDSMPTQVHRLIYISQRLPTNYKDAIKRMLRNDERRLVVNLDDLRDYNREFCDGCAAFI